MTELTDQQRAMIDWEMTRLIGFTLYVHERWRWKPSEMAVSELLLQKQLSVVQGLTG